ncbi:PAS domain S-box protein [Pseudomonas sp.]|uniref:PAS domain S-box protein n=1 Tax=Pseudomonas sp. TaxID=306 RepID=UPI003565D729
MDDRYRSVPRKHLAVWVTLVLLLGLGGGVVWQWQSLETRNREASQQRFQLEVQDIEQRVLSRMRAYEMVLRGISGLMIGSEQVALEHWDRAVEQLRLQDRYPGIMALGWARHVEQSRLDDFLTDVQVDGRLDYRLFPPGSRDEYVLIDYISPFDLRNRRALGYDMLSEPTRRAAIEQARSSGDVTLSAQLILRQETEADAQGGVLLYLPVFRPGMPVSSAEERRAALFGFVYGAFRIKELMAGILGAQSRLFDITIKDLQATGPLVLGGNEEQSAAFEPHFRRTMALDLYGRTWQLEVAGTAQYETTSVSSQSMSFSLWMGLAAASLLAFLVGGYLYLRERELYASRVATEQLSEREERFRLLIERLPVATLLCTAEGQIEMANQRAAELLDCAPETLVGERVRRFLPMIDQLGELLDETDTPMLANDYEARRASGERIPVTLSLSVLAVSGGASYLLNLIDLRARKGAEERFRLVVEASPNAIVLVDSKGRIAMVNRQTELMFGYERQELLDQTVEKLLPRDQREGHVDLRRGYQDNPEPRRMGNNRDLFGQHRDGRLIPLEVGLSPIRSGEETLVQAVIIDISERKAAEQRFRLVVEASPNAIVLVDSQGLISMVNQQTEQMFGHARQELLGQPVEMLLPMDLRHGHTAFRRGYQDNPEPRRMGNNRELFGQHRDGRLIPLEVGLSPLRSGQESWVQAVIIDISERKAAEQRFRLVVEASPNAIVLVDSEGLISMVNQQTEQMFGHARQELLGQPVEMLLPMDLRHGHMAFRRGYQDNPEPRRMGNNRDLFGQHRDGRLIPLEVGLSPIRSGEETLVQAVIIDISERKAAEQRLRDQAEQLILANRYKSEFLANMSHELRTPLNSILILSDQLRLNSAGNLTSKQARHADIVHRAGSDLLQLINSVLDLAKVESGRMQIKLESLNVQEMLVELDASMRPLAELKGLQLRTQLEPGVPRDIHSDRARLHQILRNLLSNSLKFTERGEVNLTVACEPDGRDDGRVQLNFSVRDTGIGIAPEHHEQIFQAFQQIDGSTSRRFGGTGLGLAITRKLAQALDGEVSLQSTPGQGSCFTVHVPVPVPVPVQVVIQGEPEEHGPQRSGAGPAVLIVEDDADFAMVIIDEAHAHGFSCVHCRTGVQALHLLQHERFSAVILDILLPDISGWQLFRRLRGQVSHRDIPVHIISCVPQPPGWNDDGTRYLVKPIDRVDLEQVFIDLQQADQAPGPALLLVEDVEVEREFYRGYLQQLGFDVVTSASAADARRAYAERHFSVLVIDLDLPDQDGFDLLESLDRLRPRNGTRVVINTGVDVTQQALQRLRHYSAVVVRKEGDDLQVLSLAVQGFLGSVRDPVQAFAVPADQVGRSLDGRRVLLVDDDVRNVYALTALLDDAGLRVRAAKDGVEAIARYQSGSFDLILMDIAMPNMDGYTAIRLLKQEHRCTIPIIALTAHAMKGDREKCLDAGADDYLAKPVSRDELFSMLARWLPKTDGQNDPLRSVLP